MRHWQKSVIKLSSLIVNLHGVSAQQSPQCNSMGDDELAVIAVAIGLGVGCAVLAFCGLCCLCCCNERPDCRKIGSVAASFSLMGVTISAAILDYSIHHPPTPRCTS